MRLLAIILGWIFALLFALAATALFFMGGTVQAALLALAAPAPAQQQVVHFSVDWQGPTISVPDTGNDTVGA